MVYNCNHRRPLEHWKQYYIYLKIYCVFASKLFAKKVKRHGALVEIAYAGTKTKTSVLNYCVICFKYGA